MSDTPETDAELNLYFRHGEAHQISVTWVEFARKLERERDEARKQAAMWKANHDNQVSLKAMLMDRPDLGDRASRIAELIRERDEARHKLELCMAANSDVARIAKERDEARELHRKALSEREATEKEVDAMLERSLKAERERDEARIVTGDTSDGFHTFNDLYEHRCTLFLALMASNPNMSWASAKHFDGSAFDGWFVAGMELPTGDVTYHLPDSMWEMAKKTGACIMVRGKEWDGHSASDVIERIQKWVKEEAREALKAFKLNKKHLCDSHRDMLGNCIVCQMSETDAAEAKRRAEWLHKHKAHKDWVILSVSEIAVIRAELEATERERDEAQELAKEADLGHDMAISDLRKCETELAEATTKLAEISSLTESIVEKANALIARWDQPSWKDTAPTARFINALRIAVRAYERGTK